MQDPVTNAAGQAQDFVTRWLFDPQIGRFVAAAIGLLFVVAVVRLAQSAVSRRVSDADLRYRLRKIVAFAGYALAILLLLNVFSSRLGQLTVAFGVAGAGIAFALQEVIASVAGWLAVSWGGFFRPGDRVQLGGIKGDVIDIGILRTTLMEVGQWVDGDLYNGRVVRVANSFVFKEPVFNYSADFPFLWDEVRIPIKYGSDWRLARRILQEATAEVVGDFPERAAEHWATMVRQYRLENATVEPMVTLFANDNWLEFTVRYVVDFKRRRITKDRLFEKILDAFDATDGRVGIASATFHLVEAPALDVRVRQVAGDAA